MSEKPSARCANARSRHECAGSRPIRNVTTSALSRSWRLFWAGLPTATAEDLRAFPTAADRERRSAADHQRDGDGATVLLQGDVRPRRRRHDISYSSTSRASCRASSRRRRCCACWRRPLAPKHKAALTVTYGPACGPWRLSR